MKTYIVRCCIGGCVIGGRLESDSGEPLTFRQARKLAKAENERSARRREQKLGGCFEFHVDSFERTNTP